MKIIISALSFLISVNVFACPDLSGHFFDTDAEMIRTITQDNCISTTWSDEDGTTTLMADEVERILEQEGSMTAYATVFFTSSDLVIDIRMDYGGHNDFDLPVRWITSYRIDKFNNLVEKIEPFKEDGSAQGIEFVTFRRANQ